MKQKNDSGAGKESNGTHPDGTAKRKIEFLTMGIIKEALGQIKQNNIHNIGVPQGEERKKGAEN